MDERRREAKRRRPRGRDGIRDASGRDARRSGVRPRAHLLVHVDVRRRLDADDVSSLVAEHQRGAVAEHLVALVALEDDEGASARALGRGAVVRHRDATRRAGGGGVNGARARDRAGGVDAGRGGKPRPADVPQCAARCGRAGWGARGKMLSERRCRVRARRAQQLLAAHPSGSQPARASRLPNPETTVCVPGLVATSCQTQVNHPPPRPPTSRETLRATHTARRGTRRDGQT